MVCVETEIGWRGRGVPTLPAHACWKREQGQGWTRWAITGRRAKAAESTLPGNSRRATAPIHNRTHTHKHPTVVTPLPPHDPSPHTFTSMRKAGRPKLSAFDLVSSSSAITMAFFTPACPTAGKRQQDQNDFGCRINTTAGTGAACCTPAPGSRCRAATGVRCTRTGWRRRRRACRGCPCRLLRRWGCCCCCCCRAMAGRAANPVAQPAQQGSHLCASHSPPTAAACRPATRSSCC